MPIFEYEAVDASGQPLKGTVMGADLQAVGAVLQQRGLKVNSLNAARVHDPLNTATPSANTPPVAQTQAARSDFDQHLFARMFGGVGLAHLKFFFDQLGSMLYAGVNPAQSLMTLSTQTAHPKLKGVLVEMSHAAQRGEPISTTMERYPEVFTPVMLNLVKAGEMGGFLPQALKDVAGYIQSEMNIRNIIRSSTMMPKITLAASILIIGGASLLIRAIAPDSPVQITSPLTELSTWMVLGPLLLLIWFVVKVVLPNPRMRYSYDRFVAALPGIGPTVTKFATAKFGRSFGTLYKGGISPPVAIQLAAAACGNEYMAARLRPAAQAMEQGAGITSTLASTGVFNPIVLDMMSTGEMTGEIDQMLTKTAEYYEAEGTHAAELMGRLLGVLTLILVAIYVVMVVINFFSGYVSGLMRATGN